MSLHSYHEMPRRRKRPRYNLHGTLASQAGADGRAAPRGAHSTASEAIPEHPCIYEDVRSNTAGGQISGAEHTGAMILVFAKDPGAAAGEADPGRRDGGIRRGPTCP